MGEHPMEQGREPLVVTVTKTDLITKLGLDISHYESYALRIKKVKPGLVGVWNEAHADEPEKLVQAGDIIVEVNGHRGSPKSLLEIIARDEVLKFTVIQSTGMVYPRMG